MIFHDEDITLAYNEYVVERGPDEEREPLLAIIHDELELTRQAILRSPILRGRGQSAILRDILLALRNDKQGWNEDFKDLGLWLEEHARDDEIVTYWTLDVTELVYIADSRLGRLENGQILTKASLNSESLQSLEEIIQGLRLLRTPFNGAVE